MAIRDEPSQVEGAMQRRVRAGAGALGGVAAGFVLLSATCALAMKPAAIRPSPQGSDNEFHGLRIVGGEGTLTPITSEGSLTAITGVPVVRLSVALGLANWNPGGGDPITCLAQAIYFEARSESEVGQEAVAQVVINRTRLPQYASTVCGVVYQGSERSTGCQFTFVCDGSLREPSDMVAWDRAVAIAKQALAGFVCKPAMDATHYHAAWMTPYWSGQFTRIGQIGGHVFYH
jgi:hypothetical protein